MQLATARLPLWLLGLWLVCGAGFAAADEPQAVARLVARVNDSTATLTAQQRGLLKAKLMAFEGEKGSRMQVVGLPDGQTRNRRAIRAARRRSGEARSPGNRRRRAVAGGEGGTASCASRSATDWKARSTTPPRSESSAKRSARVSSRATITAVSMPVWTR